MSQVDKILFVTSYVLLCSSLHLYKRNNSLLGKVDKLTTRTGLQNDQIHRFETFIERNQLNKQFEQHVEELKRFKWFSREGLARYDKTRPGEYYINDDVFGQMWFPIPVAIKKE